MIRIKRNEYILLGIPTGELVMAAITDAEAIRFVNEQIRPLAEELRNLNSMLNNAKGIWVGGGLNSLFTNAADTIEDGREGQGVSRLTAGDVTALIAELSTIITQFGGAGVMDVIRKPTVRRMTVGSD